MRVRNWMLLAGGLLTAALLVACGGSTDESTESAETAASNAPAASAEPATAVTPAAREEAQQIFETRCTACHGPDGRGDGPGAGGLDPKPRNYHDPDWQQTVTDEEIETAIVYGGAAVGKSPLMGGNPDLANKPAVVSALRDIVRRFGQEP